MKEIGDGGKEIGDGVKEIGDGGKGIEDGVKEIGDGGRGLELELGSKSFEALFA